MDHSQWASFSELLHSILNTSLEVEIETAFLFCFGSEVKEITIIKNKANCKHSIGTKQKRKICFHVSLQRGVVFVVALFDVIKAAKRCKDRLVVCDMPATACTC